MGGEDGFPLVVRVGDGWRCVPRGEGLGGGEDISLQW